MALAVVHNVCCDSKGEKVCRTEKKKARGMQLVRHGLLPRIVVISGAYPSQLIVAFPPDAGCRSRQKKGLSTCLRGTAARVSSSSSAHDTTTHPMLPLHV